MDGDKKTIILEINNSETVSMGHKDQLNYSLIAEVRAIWNTKYNTIR